MFISVKEGLHPNLIKIAMLLVAERTLGKDAKAFKALKKFKVNKDSNVFVDVKDLLLANDLSVEMAFTIIKESCSLILSLENPMDVIAEYVYSAEVVADIRSKVNAFNNNKNSYDLNTILNNFKEFILRYSINKYDLESDNLKAFLGNAYNRFYSKDEKYRKDILEVLNSRGSVVNGEEGAMSLTDKIGFSDDSRNSYQIDFPSVVKDISLASDELFNINNEVVYDLFSFYLEENSKMNYENIQNLFLEHLGSPELLPIISEKKTIFATKYTENTVNKRYLMLKRVYNILENGLFSNNVEGLYNDLKSIDMDTLNSVNVSTLFKYPKPNASSAKIESIDVYNKDLFLKILRGVVSLREFVKYLKLNKIEFSDYNLFRDKNNYKRYNTLESYISIHEISKGLIEESKDTQIELPYYENDRLYDVLNQRYNLSSLSSIYNEHLSKMYSEQNPSDEYISRLVSLMEINFGCKSEMEQCISDLKAIGEDPSSEVSYNYIVESVPSLLPIFESYFMEGSSSYYLKDVLLDTHDIFNLLRFFDFSLMIFDHLRNLLDLTNLSEDKLFFSDNLGYLDFPREVSSIDDLAKIKSDIFSLSFYTEESSEYVDSPIKVGKFYSALFEIINLFISDIVEFVDSWSYKFKESLDSYGISVVKSLEFSNVKLRSKLVSIESLNDNLTKNFLDLSYKFSEINGLLSDNGVPIVYEGYLVHSKGYLLATFNDFSITKISESQCFDVSKIKPWRGVLWKV